MILSTIISLFCIVKLSCNQIHSVPVYIYLVITTRRIPVLVQVVGDLVMPALSSHVGDRLCYTDAIKGRNI